MKLSKYFLIFLFAVLSSPASLWAQVTQGASSCQDGLYLVDDLFHYFDIAKRWHAGKKDKSNLRLLEKNPEIGYEIWVWSVAGSFDHTPMHRLHCGVKNTDGKDAPNHGKSVELYDFYVFVVNTSGKELFLGPGEIIKTEWQIRNDLDGFPCDYLYCGDSRYSNVGYFLNPTNRHMWDFMKISNGKGILTLNLDSKVKLDPCCGRGSYVQSVLSSWTTTSPSFLNFSLLKKPSLTPDAKNDNPGGNVGDNCIHPNPSKVQCPPEQRIVCGCDNVSYQNACLAQKVVKKWSAGPCLPCYGAIRTLPCPRNIDPVCGCDGITYNNACEATNAGINISFPGPCPKFVEQIPKPTDCIGVPLFAHCNDVVDYVCGCNGLTYLNECEARNAGVLKWSKGSCNGDPVGKPKPPADKPRPPVSNPKPPAGKPKPPVGNPKPPVGNPKPPVGNPDPPMDDTGSSGPASPSSVFVREWPGKGLKKITSVKDTVHIVYRLVGVKNFNATQNSRTVKFNVTGSYLKAVLFCDPGLNVMSVSVNDQSNNFLTDSWDLIYDTGLELNEGFPMVRYSPDPSLGIEFSSNKPMAEFRYDASKVDWVTVKIGDRSPATLMRNNRGEIFEQFPLNKGKNVFTFTVGVGRVEYSEVIIVNH